MSRPCLMAAWSSSESELLGYLRRRGASDEDAEELVQEIFVKALRQGEGFCALENPRAWLFQVARNALTDLHRASRQHVPLPEDIVAPDTEVAPPVDGLSQCLPRALSELSETDRAAIIYCDIEGKSQQQFADYLGISLPGAKSRIQRARQRLKTKLEKNCKVRFDDEGNVCCFTARPALPA